MMVTKEGLKQAHFEKSTNPQFDENGNPIYKGDGIGIDWKKVKPVK